MKFARRLFAVAGIYGVVTLVPLYFLEARIAIDQPPAITHPEYYYGFTGVALAWQLMFLVIAKDPIRYRLAILPSIFEKWSAGIAASVLYAQSRVSLPIFASGLVDLALGILFAAAFVVTGKQAAARPT